MVIYIIAFSEGKIWEGTREDPPWSFNTRTGKGGGADSALSSSFL